MNSSIKYINISCRRTTTPLQDCSKRRGTNFLFRGKNNKQTRHLRLQTQVKQLPSSIILSVKVLHKELFSEWIWYFQGSNTELLQSSEKRQNLPSGMDHLMNKFGTVSNTKNRKNFKPFVGCHAIIKPSKVEVAIMNNKATTK